MTFDYLTEKAARYLENAPGNYIDKDDALRPELTGMRIFDAPIFAVADARDPLFIKLREPGVVGPETLLPTDWTSDAQSVLSLFAPFTERVRRANAVSMSETSDEWLHGRIEGQRVLNGLGEYIRGLLTAEGYSAAYPATDSRFRKTAPYVSNWSERHIAYVCGLGTFGLSRGLITRRGVAGRFASVVTSAPLPVTPRPYSSPFEYCIMCGKCQVNCPAHAIDVKRGVIDGKDQDVCGPYVNATARVDGPRATQRYGCGKCQVNVPCETGIPNAIAAHVSFD